MYVLPHRLFHGGSGKSLGAECHSLVRTLVGRILGARCTNVHMSRLSTKSKGKGSLSCPTQLGYPPLFGEDPTSQGKKQRGGRKSLGKKTVSTSPAESTNFGELLCGHWSRCGGTNVEKQPLLRQRRKRPRPKGRWRISTPGHKSFSWFDNDSYIILTAGIDFPDLGVFQIEAEHPVPDLDNLVAILEERSFTLLTSLHLRRWKMWKRLT